MYCSNYLPPKHLTAAIEALFQKFPAKKVLIGLSGGADSIALFWTLKALKERLGFELGVAHIDHRWRKESQEEAGSLFRLCESQKIPFHLEVLNVREKVDLENVCRQKRLQFFKKLCSQEGYEAVFLAHHKDDLVETILKRIFEGASFQTIPSMKKISVYEGLKLFRPWLDVPKTAILEWVKQADISFFEDPTNLDPLFLRGRMRVQLFPEIEKNYGKSIREPLLRLGKECGELNDYFREKWSFLFRKGKPWCNYLDCRVLMHRFEMRWVVREWLQRLRLNLSHAAIETLIELLINSQANRQIKIKNGSIQIDRRQLFYIDDQIVTKPVMLQEEFEWGPWQVSLKPYVPNLQEQRGWKAAFSGEMMIYASCGETPLFIGHYAELLNGRDKTSLQKKWTNEKIPAFFRSFVPVIALSGELKADFLSPNATLQAQIPDRIICLKTKQLYLENSL